MNVLVCGGAGYIGSHTVYELIEKGFNPHSSPYYVVLHFDNSHPIPINNIPNLKEDKNTYRAKIKKLSEFVQQ